MTTLSKIKPVVSRPLVYYCASVCLLLFSCSKESAEHESSKPEEYHEVSLSRGQMEKASLEWQLLPYDTIPIMLQVSGLIDLPPQNIATISLPYPGFIKSILVYQGARVHKGTVLAECFHPNFITLQQTFLEACAKEEQLYLERVRQQDLQSQSVTSSKALELAVADFTVASAQRKAKEAELKLLGIDPAKIRSGVLYEHIKLKAPVHGVVSKVNVNIGKLTQPDQILFELLDIAHLHAELQVFEKDIHKVSEGQTVYLRTQADTNSTLATIFLINRVLHPVTRHALIHCHIENESSARLFPGQYVQANITVGKQEGYVMPQEALISYNDAHWALLLRKVDKDSTVTFKLTQVQVLMRNAKIAVLRSEDALDSTLVLTKGALQVFAQWRKLHTDEAEE